MIASPMMARRQTISPPPPVDATSVCAEAVLSAEELDLLRAKFSKCNTSAQPSRALATAKAIRLFREDYPTLSEWEIHDMFSQCDLNNDGQLSLVEYQKTRAYYRLLQEERTANELLRCFAILDTDNDGMLREHEVNELLARSGQPVITVLTRAITQAALDTKNADISSTKRTRSRDRHFSLHREGEITFESFAVTIRDINRKMEQEIAAKTLRAMYLKEQLALANGLPEDNGSSPPALTRQQKQSTPTSKERAHTSTALRIELEVAEKEVHRIKHELISGVHDSTLGQICETLVATYDNEQHVYECLSNMIDYCALRDPTQLRYKLERSGRSVNVLDAVLMAPPDAIKVTWDCSITVSGYLN